MKLYRSFLYVPADNARALQKAAQLATDVIIFDLEDAVAPEKKEEARAQLKQALQTTSYHQTLLLRVNGINTPWHTEDMQLAKHLPLHGVVFPKVEQWSVEHNVLSVPAWAVIETPLGVLNAAKIASCSSIQGLIMGANDLAKELDIRLDHLNEPRIPLLSALSQVVLVARANRKIPIDAVFNHIQDQAGLCEECRQGRNLGFTGKTLIHPSQIETANQYFGVSEEEKEKAKALIASWEKARALGQSIITFQGSLVEQMHVDAAKTTVAQWEKQRTKSL